MTLPTAPRFWRRFRTPMNFPSTHTYAHTKGFFLVGWVSSKRFSGERRRRKGRKEGQEAWMRERERETEDRLKEYGMEEKSVWPTLARVTRCSLLLIDQPLREVARFFSTFFQGHLIIPRLSVNVTYKSRTKKRKKGRGGKEELFPLARFYSMLQDYFTRLFLENVGI